MSRREFIKGNQTCTNYNQHGDRCTNLAAGYLKSEEGRLGGPYCRECFDRMEKEYRQKLGLVIRFVGRGRVSNGHLIIEATN